MIKTIRKMALVLAAITLLVGCGANNSSKAVSSKEMFEVLQGIDEGASYNKFYGIDENGNAAVIFNPYPETIEAYNRFYYGSTGIREYFEEKYNATIDDMDFYNIEGSIFDEDEEVQSQKHFDELFRLLSEAANVTLTEEEKEQIKADALAKAEEQIKVFEIENMNFELEYAGINPEELDAFLYSTSQMMTSAYTVAIFTVKDAANLEKYTTVANNLRDQKIQMFEHYLPDQYEFASKSEVKVEGNTVILIITQLGAEATTAIANKVAGK